MTNPKRYDPVIYGDEAVVDDGPYVKWEDYERLTRDMSALQSQWDDMQQGFVEVFGEPVRDAIELLGATERLRSAHEPLEQRLRTPLGEPALTHVDGLPGTRESVVIEPQGNADESPALFPQQMEPDTSPLTHQEMFSAIHSLAADIVRLTAAVPAQCTQGASRDASSPCPSVHDHMWAADGHCMRCYAQRPGPADLVGALQDVVHTDPGPVRAGKAHRDAFSEFVCPNHGPVQQLTDSGDCPMCYQDRHAQRTGEQL